MLQEVQNGKPRWSEGNEFDLLCPDLAPVLSQADLIVEMHDNYRPGVTEALVRRFVPSHQIEIVYHGAKYPVEFPVLKAVPATEHAWLLQEGRARSALDAPSGKSARGH
jgi:hypothetical protein